MIAGVTLALSSAAFSTAKDVVSKQLSRTIDGATSTLASFAFAIPWYLLVIFLTNATGLLPLDISLALLGSCVLRAFTDAAAERFKMEALARGELSLLAPFLALAPVFLLILSPLLTGDRYSALGAFGLLLTVLGTFIILPGRRALSLTATTKSAILLAIASSAAFSLNSVLDRIAAQAGHPILAGFLMTLFAGFLSAPGVIRNRSRMNLLKSTWRHCTLRGAFELLFMVLKLAALQYLQAPYVVALQRVSVVFSVIIGGLVLKESDFPRRLAASLVILSGIALVISEIV